MKPAAHTDICSQRTHNTSTHTHTHTHTHTLMQKHKHRALHSSWPLVPSETNFARVAYFSGSGEIKHGTMKCTNDFLNKRRKLLKQPDRVGTIQSRHLSLLHLQCAPSSVNFSLDGGEEERERERERELESEAQGQWQNTVRSLCLTGDIEYFMFAWPQCCLPLLRCKCKVQISPVPQKLHSFCQMQF